MMISKETEKAFDKMQHPLVIKTLSKQRKRPQPDKKPSTKNSQPGTYLL